MDQSSVSGMALDKRFGKTTGVGSIFSRSLWPPAWPQCRFHPEPFRHAAHPALLAERSAPLHTHPGRLQLRDPPEVDSPVPPSPGVDPPARHSTRRTAWDRPASDARDSPTASPRLGSPGSLVAHCVQHSAPRSDSVCFSSSRFQGPSRWRLKHGCNPFLSVETPAPLFLYSHGRWHRPLPDSRCRCALPSWSWGLDFSGIFHAAAHRPEVNNGKSMVR